MTPSSPHPTLANPPIVEAVLEVMVDAPQRGFLEIEDQLKAVWGVDYPRAKRIFLENAHFTVSADASASPTWKTTSEVGGLRFEAKDARQILQVKSDRLAFNRLTPYSSLDDYLPEIHERFRQYCQIAQPAGVKSISLRFINRIALPFEAEGGVNLEEYLKDAPRLIAPGDFSLSGFLNQQQLVHKGNGLVARLLQTVLPPEEGKLPLIFDIEVSQPKHYFSVTDERIWTTVNELRILKNQLFHQNLTPLCLSLFQ